jgi:cyclopropane-fatty-acyl-phospholipid synthase
MDAHRGEIMPLFDKTYGGHVEAVKWWNRWRVFYLSCAELFGYNQGQEWVVAHYLFKRR